MSRRKGSKKKAGSTFGPIVTAVTWGVVFFLLIAALFGAGYYLGYTQAEQEGAAAYAKERQKMMQQIKRLEDERLKRAERVSQRDLKLKEVLRRDGKKYAAGAQHEYGDGKQLGHPPKGPARETRRVTELPKLAIIIDDVAFAHDVRAIKQLGLPLSMSFLPPSERHPDSARLAANEPFYMVHLPMEAMNFSSEEPFTLRANDSQQLIMERINTLKKIFPKVKYINNHTGSAFTSNERAMNRLIFSLTKEKIHFIDSRTTAETKVPKVMKNYGLPYVARDVFLDHDADIAAIKKQIKRAVAIAKQHGSAIAIGHPHKQTLKALEESKSVLQGVELVRIDELI